MNKTVTINISGIVFNIEEDAYAGLSGYLSSVKQALGHSAESREVLNDIESRIAELLRERLGNFRQVVLNDDVEYVKSVMGNPEDFQLDMKSGEEKTFYREEKIKRRLYRNPDDKMIGGVCGGLAAYFEVDAVWVRLAMFILLFLGGLSIWVYVILWIVMPLAQTTADKLAMRGEVEIGRASCR